MKKIKKMNLSNIITSKRLRKAAYRLIKFFLSEHDKLVLSWKENHLYETLSLTYPLSKRSLVFDLGGYKGQWTSDIFSKYLCKVFIFEPVSKFAKEIEGRFKLNPKIKVYTFGLSDSNRYIDLYLDDDGTSAFVKKGKHTSGKLVEFISFVNKEGINRIDLMKLNIEGGEYDLLEHIIRKGWITRIKNLQIQFHSFVPNAEDRRQKIQQELSKTHKITYQFEFLWESWTIE